MLSWKPGFSLSLKNKYILNFYQTIASGLAALNAYSTWASLPSEDYLRMSGKPIDYPTYL